MDQAMQKPAAQLSPAARSEPVQIEEGKATEF